MRRLSQSEKGFTLVELMVVIVLIGIMASILAWGSAGFRQNYQVRQSVREVVSYLNYAKMQAAVRHRAVRVVILGQGEARRFVSPPTGMISVFNDGGGTGNIIKAKLGGVIVEEGVSGSILKAFPEFLSTVDLSKRIKKYYSLSRESKLVSVVRTYYGTGGQTGAMTIYFRPDGQVVRCLSSGICRADTFNICIRTSSTGEQSGPASVPRRIELQSNGVIRVQTKNPLLCRPGNTTSPVAPSPPVIPALPSVVVVP